MVVNYLKKCNSSWKINGKININQIASVGWQILFQICLLLKQPHTKLAYHSLTMDNAHEPKYNYDLP